MLQQKGAKRAILPTEQHAQTKNNADEDGG